MPVLKMLIVGAVNACALAPGLAGTGTSNGQKGCEGQPGNHGNNGQRGYEGQPGNQGN